MTIEQDVNDASGDMGNSENNEGNQQNSVQYDTYKRTVSQLKKTQDTMKSLEEQLNAYKTKEQEASERQLAEQGEYQKLLDLERKKNLDAEAKIKENENLMLNAHKLSAFREKLPGQLKNKAYYDFVDVENIILDPTTGAIDNSSLDQVVNGFLQEHSALVESSNSPTLPGYAPKNAEGRLSYDEWLKLPLVEQKKRFQEMRRNDLNK